MIFLALIILWLQGVSAEPRIDSASCGEHKEEVLKDSLGEVQWLSGWGRRILSRYERDALEPTEKSAVKIAFKEVFRHKLSRNSPYLPILTETFNRTSVDFNKLPTVIYCNADWLNETDHGKPAPEDAKEFKHPHYFSIPHQEWVNASRPGKDAFGGINIFPGKSPKYVITIMPLSFEDWRALPEWQPMMMTRRAKRYHQAVPIDALLETVTWTLLHEYFHVADLDDELYVPKSGEPIRAYAWEEVTTLAKQDVKRAIKNPNSLTAYLYILFLVIVGPWKFEVEDGMGMLIPPNAQNAQKSNKLKKLLKPWS